MRSAVVITSIVFLCIVQTPSVEAFNSDSANSKIKIVFQDGSKYIGQMKDGIRHGHGRFINPDGSEYCGEFRNGEPHGKGIVISSDGRKKRVVYIGGTMVEASLINHTITEDGCVFGEFVSNGRYTGWFKGNRIKGYVPHGRGTMRYFNGSVYTGQWRNGKMHGNGAITWDDSSKYSGEWLEGKRTGYGTYTWPNGDTYVGRWKENEMCGEGIYYHHDGRIQKGIWKEKTVKAIE